MKKGFEWPTAGAEAQPRCGLASRACCVRSAHDPDVVSFQWLLLIITFKGVLSVAQLSQRFEAPHRWANTHLWPSQTQEAGTCWWHTTAAATFSWAQHISERGCSLTDTVLVRGCYYCICCKTVSMQRMHHFNWKHGHCTIRRLPQ